MSTEFKLVFEGEPDLEIAKFQQSLSSDFEIIQRGDDVYVRIKSATAEDPRCQYLIDRELDRHFFLTFVKIRAEMVRTTAWNAVEIRYSIHGSLPDDIRPQNWDDKLPIQLRLWSIAADTNDIWVKLILLFQIIELSDPHYPEYADSTTIGAMQRWGNSVPFRTIRQVMIVGIDRIHRAIICAPSSLGNSEQ